MITGVRSITAGKCVYLLKFRDAQENVRGILIDAGKHPRYTDRYIDWFSWLRCLFRRTFVMY